jgi:hypothetical protein
MDPRAGRPLTHHPASDATLDIASIDAIALRVVELMRTGEATSVNRRLVDATTLATELGVTRSWVYEHRDELGAVRLGAGPKPRLRFDIETASQALERNDRSGVRPSDTGGAARAATLGAGRRRKRQPRAGSILAARPRTTS